MEPSSHNINLLNFHFMEQLSKESVGKLVFLICTSTNDCDDCADPGTGSEGCTCEDF